MPFAAVVLAMLPAVLDQTVLATALPKVATDLGEVTDVSWLVTVYVIAAAASTPLWGKLGDRHGRPRLIRMALVVFLGASAACGLAQDLTMLIVSRAAQGMAAGGLMSLAMAAVGDLVSPRERARYQGYIAAVFAAVTVAGPLVGGLVVEHIGWRWVFYLNLPLGLAALAALSWLPQVPSARPTRALDLSGAVLLAGALSTLMLACLWGGERYAWDSTAIVGALVAAATLTIAFVARERRAADPVLPLGMLRQRTIAVASASLFLATGTMFAVIVFVPVVLQTATGASPTEAGLLLVPMMLGIALSTNVAGRAIARSGRYRAFPIAGLALMSGALLAGAAAVGESSQALTAGALALFGLGFGVVGQVLTVAVQNDVDRRQLGTAMATVSLARGLGGAVGAAVFGAVFSASAGTDASASGAAGSAAIVDATQTVLLVAAPLAALALLAAMALRERPLADAAPSSPTTRPAAPEPVAS